MDKLAFKETYSAYNVLSALLGYITINSFSVNALRLSEQFFSHAEMYPGLNQHYKPRIFSGYNEYFKSTEDKGSCSRTQQAQQ